MAARRKLNARESQLAFEALSVEGALLSPSWLSKVAQVQAGAQTEADYCIPKGLNLRDEIGRYWRIAQAHWTDLKKGHEAKADPRELAERFFSAFLREAFGFSSVAEIAPIRIAEREYPIGRAALAGRVPVVIAPYGSGLDTLSLAFGEGGKRRSAFGLAQEYLNAQEGALWGLACDGATLRIVRDNSSLTRPAWIEADLSRIFTEERYSDFAALWLLVHETRFGREGQPVSECALEAWRNAGREEGIPARDRLRRGVEEALIAFGQGFLSHRDNQALRADLQSGALTTRDYFNELLRLVYRLIFLLTVEERGLLHPDGVSDAAKALYATGYSLRHLSRRAAKRSAHDHFWDLWETAKIVFRGLASGEPRLGLPALAGIFSSSQCKHLDGCRLENRALLFAVFKLAWLRDDGSLARVNWRDMGPEELGSVYESLLELVPQITNDGRQFAFASGGETKGNARKTTGSYYTPDSLVHALLDSALDPVIVDTVAKNSGNPTEALLNLSIVDPACGSGHFLLAAARRLAAHVARLQANGTPSAAEYRHALRQVVSRCIFGVDLNPMAVELCKVSLWMEAVEPGLPLTFLNSHIQHGNALLGTTPDLMTLGIPDAAWDPIEGDDKKFANLLKKRNRVEAGGQRSLTLGTDPTSDESKKIKAAVLELEAVADADAVAIASKEERWEEILALAAYRHQKLVADAWCAAFVWPKHAASAAEAAPTNGLWRDIRDGLVQQLAATTKTVHDLAKQYRFFHWHLQFPQVFARGGFDLVLGNPPWESLVFKEAEFFAERRPDISNAATAAIRKRMITVLAKEDAAQYAMYVVARREIEGANAFVRSGVRFPLCGVGRVNLFALFAEVARQLVSPTGRIGQILPSGIVTDDSTKLFFQAVIDSGQLVSFLDFENQEGIFPEVHRQVRFGLLTLVGSGARSSAEFLFLATKVEDLSDSMRRFNLSAAEIALLNPTTRTCPVFRSRKDAEIIKAIYKVLPVLSESGWNLELRRLLNSADDSGQFCDSAAEGRLPLYEGKHFHHYNHRWLTSDGAHERKLSDGEQQDPYFAIQPRYWYPSGDIAQRFGAAWPKQWVFALRKITNVANERTFIASVIPSLAVSDSAKVFFAQEDTLKDLPGLIANSSAFAMDFVSRQKLSGWNMSTYVAEQMPVVPLAAYSDPARWDDAVSLGRWITPRVLELTCTTFDLEPFARDLGYHGPPFRWDPGRRRLLRCELDAAFFHLYGLSRDDTDYVMESFPLVRNNDEKEHGEYRTKRIILEIYDAMAEATRRGASYQTLLDPPPADPRVAHAPRIIALPTMPAVVPQLPAAEEISLFVIALLHAAGGTVSRIDLARAFAFRARPDLLVRLAPASLTQAQAWATKVERRSVTKGVLAATLRALSERDGLTLGTDSESRSTVTTSVNTPADERLDPWYRFEARLALQVLRAQPESAFRAVDEFLMANDPALFERAS